MFGAKTCHFCTQLEHAFPSRVHAEMQPTVAGTVQKKSGFIGPSRDAQNVCAVAKGGTVRERLRHLSNSSS